MVSRHSVEVFVIQNKTEVQVFQTTLLQCQEAPVSILINVKIALTFIGLGN